MVGINSPSMDLQRSMMTLSLSRSMSMWDFEEDFMWRESGN